jgi:hypothetical protein
MTMNYQELASFWGNPVPSCDPYTLVVGGNSESATMILDAQCCSSDKCP